MPDPRDIEEVIRDPRFQELSAPDQHAALRGFMARQDPKFDALHPIDQQDVTSTLIEKYTPGLLSKIGDVAEYVPVVGGAVSGYRAAEAGQPARPLTRVLSAGLEAASPAGRAVQEAGRDVAELAAVGGLTGLARPLLGKLAASLAGGVMETGAGGAAVRLGASELMDAALRATTDVGAAKLAGSAARVALRQRFVERGLTELTAGELFGAANAIERGIAGGEPEPLEDFVKTPLGVAALGTAFLGAGEIARRFGLRSIQPIVEDIARRDPERMAQYQNDAARVVDAVRKASGGRLNNEAAAEVVFNSIREPLAAVQDTKVLKDALRQYPEIVDSELGLHILRTQRERLAAPEVRVTASPGIRVTYDDEQGRTVTEILDSPAAQRAFAKRVGEGRIIVDNAAGDEAAILRSGVRAGTPLQERVAPGGGPGRLVSEEGVGPVGTFGGAIQLPQVRPEVADLNATVQGAAGELRRAPITGVPDVAALPPAPTPEAIQRFRGGLGGPLQPEPSPAPPLRAPTAPPQLAGPQSYTVGVLQPDGDVILIPKREAPNVAPPPGTVTQTSGGQQVTVLDTPDAIGRVTVKDTSGRVLRRYVEGGIIRDREHLLEGLPLQPARPGVEFPVPGAERMVARTRALDEQIRPGQVIHQSIRDVEKRGVRPSIEVIARAGDRVLVRSGDEVIETTVADVAQTIEGGTGKFAFDMTATGVEQLEMNAEKFNARLRAGEAFGDLRGSAQQLAEDVKLSDELFAYDRRAGQRAGPATLQPGTVDEGLARRTRERKNRPETERTKGGNALVKGCK